MDDRNNVRVSANLGLPLGTIGFITWLVFLILKLCNQNNPDFEWLTWFWVWFPFWLPWAICGAFLVLALVAALIYSALDRRG